MLLVTLTCHNSAQTPCYKTHQNYKETPVWQESLVFCQAQHATNQFVKHFLFTNVLFFFFYIFCRLDMTE